MSDDRWYLSKENFDNSPSRKCGIDVEKELYYKQLAANLIHDMGSRKHLSVSQLCISTATVYMHRFYVHHSFSHFQWNAIAMASLFLAAKVEEQTRKIEHVIKVAQWCLQKSQTSIDCTTESYLEQVQELVMNENILLQTLGFDVAVKHPYAFILEFSDKFNINKDLTKTMYGMASNSLHVTSMCVQYKPSVVACFCIHFVCIWSNHVIKVNGEEVKWWTHIDHSVTPDLLSQMRKEFLADFEKSPSKLKQKVLDLLKGRHSEQPSSGSGHSSASLSSSFTASMSSLHHQKHHQPSMGNHNVSGSSRIHKSTAHLSNHHHQSTHPPLNTSASSSLVNGGVNVHPNPAIASSQLIRSNSTSHASSQQQRHPQHQLHHHHWHHVPQMASNSTQHAHKVIPPGAAHNLSKPKINPVTFGHPTNNGTGPGNGLANEMAKPDRRKVLEIRLKPGSGIKPPPDYKATAAAVASISNHRPAADAVAKNTYQKVDAAREFNRLVTSSRSDIISNVIKEVTMAKQNEKCTKIKSEPLKSEAVDGVISNGAAAKVSRSHSIFSPSPPISQFEFSPMKERISLVKVEIKEEPLFDAIQIKQEVIPAELHIKQEILPSEIQIKQESLSVTPPKLMNQRFPPGVSHSQTIPIVKEVKAVLENTPITVPSTAATSQPPTNIPKIINVVSLASHVNDVTVKKEPREIKTEPKELSTISISSQPPLIPNSIEEHVVPVVDVDTSVTAGECSSSHTHKKKKKHKEKDKDKRHKEKKRHKENKHHHRTDHSSREKERKEPGPIKITIPKEKLTDIPVKLKIKINKDQIVMPSISEEVTRPDAAVKSSEKASKSRKRKRDDHDHSSKKQRCDVSTSQNGYKDCL